MATASKYFTDLHDQAIADELDTILAALVTESTQQGIKGFGDKYIIQLLALIHREREKAVRETDSKWWKMVNGAGLSNVFSPPANAQ